MSRHFNQALITGCLLVGASGCTLQHDKATDQALQPLSSGQVLPQINGLPLPDRRINERVSIPKAAPWLSKSIVIDYQSGSALTILKQLSQHYPVQLMFDADDDPSVSSPPSALTVQDHLDAVCHQANWAYTVTSSGVVLVNDIETKTFYLAAQPGISTAEVKLRNLGAGEAASSSSTNALSVKLDPYSEELLDLLETILGLEGEQSQPPAAIAGQTDSTELAPVDPYQTDQRTQVAILPTANAIVVTAKPHKMRLVEQVLEDYMASAARSVVLHITFFEVDVSKTKERSLDLSLLRNAATTFGLNVASGGLSGANPSSLSLNFDSTGQRLSGSRTILNWLNTIGNTSIAFEDTVEVRNNAVGSLDVTTTQQYVSSISQASQSQGATTTQTPEIEFAQLKTGWSIHIQPTIVGDLVIVRLSLSRSNLVRSVPYSFDQGRIAGTTFVTSDFNRVMAIRLNDGETKLLASLNTQEAQSNNARTPWLPVIGDRKNERRRTRETVMMLSAEVL